MRVKYCGNSCFVYRTNKTKLITNPKDEGVKVNLKRVSPDIVVLSHKGDIQKDKYYLITSPGEYEVKDIFVYGYLSDVNKEDVEQADIYMFDLEDIHLCIIDKAVKKVRERVLDEIGIVNVLFISLAENAGMKLTKVSELVSKIEPQIIVPMDYTNKALKDFAKVLGVKEMEKVPSLDLEKTDFAEEEVPMRFVVMEK